jgi:hypothetical protein
MIKYHATGRTRLLARTPRFVHPAPPGVGTPAVLTYVRRSMIPDAIKRWACGPLLDALTDRLCFRQCPLSSFVRRSERL